MNTNMSFDGIRKIPVVGTRWGHRSSHLIRYSLICIYTPFTHPLRVFAPCFLRYNLELCCPSRSSTPHQPSTLISICNARWSCLDRTRRDCFSRLSRRQQSRSWGWRKLQKHDLPAVESVRQHAQWKGQLHTYRGRWQPALSERRACCLQGSKGNGVLQLEQGKRVGSSRALSGYDLDGHKSVLRPNPHQKALRCGNLVSSRAGRHRG
ncbi:hypothetical protein CPB84DRAFT_1801992 [Gymnopilus junonius]|uniref:Uncharacterized protein n=1 Tax=Gymnopilus junonius TaxID=109634 RepID=A0A9P5N7S9_GYMJU|nr:hypothetical protein CPB84DRAFT_1801992 [Gymnopilus junonius]